MKNKFYTSLLIGVGLAIVSTSSYAKPAQAAHKKSASVAAKPSKKHSIVTAKHTELRSHAKHVSQQVHSVIPVRHSLSRSHNPHLQHIISRLKNGHKIHDLSHAQKGQFSRKKSPPAGRNYLEKVLPPLVTIPHMPSQNPFVKTDVEVTETNARIHSFIPNGSQTENESAEHANLDNGPHDYTTTHGVILSSLADAGEAAGLSEDLINQLTHIFAWDIDFETNLHVGDEFIVLYESNGVDEEHIVAAEFVTDGRVLTAVRYEDSEGNVNYYTPEGKAMRKAFLSTPVDYARITSHFDAHRRHPILNRIRAHKGVDYAARTGTPVKATGDGTIAFIGRKGGYGQVVIIQHGERFETLYAHLSGFGRNIIEGDNISQGDIIGYVGQTGLATGPHLHYEFRVDGMHRNPESISSGSRNEMALDNGSIYNFKEQTRIAVAELYSAKAKSLFAKNQSTSR